MDPTVILMLAIAFGAMWLMTSRGRKQQKAAAAFRDSLAPGQEVMTSSGLFGTVVAIDDDHITLETSPGVTSRWLRQAVSKLVEPPVVADDDATDATDEDDDEYDDEFEYEDDAADGDDLDDAADHVDVPDDASSLTTDTDPDAGGTQRR
jgi:preprotein translocase subunit YajC